MKQIFTLLTVLLTTMFVNAVSYTVTFNDWDGTTLKTETVEHGSAATAPADPTRTGYTFTGWDVAFDNVTSDLTVTAEYEINTYSVTFNIVNNSSVLEGATVTIDGVDYTTDSDGVVVIDGFVAGTYSYNVNLEDFVDIAGSVTIIEADIIEDVDLEGVGISDFITYNIKVYPNPATNIVNIESGKIINSVKIVSLTGQVVYFNNRVICETIQVDVSGFKTGIYLIQTVIAGRGGIQKVVVE